MTSAYETAMECDQQSVTTSHESVMICIDALELDNPDSFQMADRTERSSSTLSSSRASLVASDEEAVTFPAEDNAFPINESYENENVNEEEKKKLKKQEKDDEVRELNVPPNSMNDTSRTNKSGDEDSLEDTYNDRYEKTKENKKKESVLASAAAGHGITLAAGASACRTTRKEQMREERRPSDENKSKKNQIVLEIQMQEGRAASSDDNDVHGDGNDASPAITDVRVRWENAVKFRHANEGPDEGEMERREIIGQQDDGGKSSFHDAVRSGNAKRVSALISGGRVQNLDEPDWNVSGDPPLLVAATNHYLPVLSTLLTSGCDPTVRSPRGETALHRVILNSGSGNVLQLVEDLLRHGCPPDIKEAGSGSTALHMLSRQLAHVPLKSLNHNYDAALKTLELLANAGPINAKDHQGRSALHILASSTIFDNNRRIDIESLIGTFLAAGVNTALKNDRGETALHESLQCGALNTASLLIPRTPAGIASRYGETPLHIASRKNYVDIVAKLLEYGEDPGQQDAGGNTPLHLASARGFHQTVSLLVTSPLAQLEKVNIDGLTALQVAAESGFINAVRILLKAGADPSQTMHHCAILLRRRPDISLLIDHELTRRRQLAA